MRKLVFLIPFALLLSCGSEDKSNQSMMDDGVDSAKQAANKLSPEDVNRILGEIPSPLETSNLIKKSGVNFNSGYLNSYDNVKNYNTSFKKALNLGVYGADLGYINIYERSKDGLSYVSAIRELAEGLNIGNFFDFEMIKRLASNSRNVDSLLNITTRNFEDINAFLHEQKRDEQSALILLGGWVEALNFTCEVAKSTKNPKLYEKVGEQKKVIEKIVLVIDNYSGNDKIADLVADLKQLQKLYDGVEISYTFKGTERQIVDGIPMFVDKTEQSVKISDDQVVNIANTLKALRNKIIS